MLPADAEFYRNPRTGGRLSLEVHSSDGRDVVTGALTGDGDTYPVVGGIPRFVPAANYAASFGYQWNAFATAQLDSRSPWGHQTAKRLAAESGWPSRMEGQRILEAASGMGRFTEVLAATGATVCTFDYSSAVDANRANNGRFPNVAFAQADIYALPYEPESFDKVLCVGAIQHCPAPRKAFESLLPALRRGGEIVIDVYQLDWQSLFLGKYYVRPLTRRLSPERLHRLVKVHVGLVYPLTGWLQKRIGRRGRSLSWLLGMADYRGTLDIDDATARQLSELDTFDMLAPAYDRPQTLGAVRRWFRDAGLRDVYVHTGPWGIQAFGRRP